ncbi:MAG: P-loop NTPase fold protein [Paludibacteraceae bacterium]
MKLSPKEIVLSENNPFDGDLLSRNQASADVLTQIIKNTEGGFTLSINADWGYGKTTFVKMWEMFLRKEGYKTIYFNAWESDFVAEPMMALIDGIRYGLQGQNLTAENLQLSMALGQVATRLLKLVPQWKLVAEIAEIFQNGINDCLEDKTDLQKYLSVKSIVSDFRKQLIELAKAVGGDKQVIIFVDELDRCRPDYAVQMLERIKHFFAIDNIIFVLSVDKIVLCKSIRAVYGGLDIDTGAYLRRFIDLDFDLPKPHPHDFIKVLYEQHKLNEYCSTYENYLAKTWGTKKDSNAVLLDSIISCFVSVQHSLRDIEKYISRLNVVMRSLDPDNVPMPLVAYLLYLHMFHFEVYEGFRIQKYEVKELWEILAEISQVNDLDNSSDQYQSLMQCLVMMLGYYAKWWKQSDKKMSIEEITSLFSTKYSNVFKNTVLETSMINMYYILSRIELVVANFNWRNLKDVIGK